MRTVLVLAALLLTAVSVQAGEPFAVVELFSSEGCSSCPSGDKALMDLASQAKADGRRIFTLSFQVDYWNYLGWVDPNSKEEFTARQYQYARALGSSSVYTPQMVVNGMHGFTGSDRTQAGQYIEEALGVPSAAEVAVKARIAPDGRLEARFTCAGIPPKALLHVALVEQGLESQVGAGENSGKLLKHGNIVKQLKTMAPTAEGVIVFDRPSRADPGHYAFVAFLQDPDSMKISGAAAVDVPTQKD